MVLRSSSSIALACRTASSLLAKEITSSRAGARVAAATASVASTKPHSSVVRSYAATTTTSSSSQDVSSSSSNGTYVSPFQEIFDRIDEGKTFLGTTSMKQPDMKVLKCGIPEFALRFKTTSYGRMLQEPFISPNEHRVTLQVPTHYLPFSNDLERMVFKELVGTRLNEETKLLQLSSIQFGSRIENKRHVVSMLDRLVESAKSLAQRLEEDVEGTGSGGVGGSSDQVVKG